MISLLVIFNNEYPHKNFFSSLEEQIAKHKDVEIIFVVQTKQNIIINKIQNLQSKHKEVNFKIISSSKSLSFNQQMTIAIKLITKKYFMIVDSSNSLNSELLDRILPITTKENVDLIEIGLEFKGKVKWNSPKRMNIKHFAILKIKEWSGIIAYVMPFVQNKIFSVKLMNKVLEETTLDVILDSSNLFSIELLYLLILKANAFIYLDNIKQTIEFNENNIINYKNLFKEWDKVINIYFQKQKYMSEIKYAYLYHIQLIVPGMYASNNSLQFFSDKDNVLLNNYYNKLIKIRQDDKFDNFELTNTYMHYANNETSLLKEVIPINKWKKIFSLLK